MLSRLFLSAALTLAAAADGDKSPAARLKAIKADVASAQAAYEKARAQLEDGDRADPAVDALNDVAVRKRLAGFAAAFEIAERDPGSDAGFAALEWLLVNAPQVYGPPEPGKAALQLMTRHHAANPKIGGAAGRVALYPPHGLPLPQDKSIPAYSDAYGPAMDLLKAVAAKNPDRTARGQAALGLALQVKRACKFTEYKAAPEAGRLRSEAEQALEAVIKDYGDCACLGATKGATTLGARARAELFELQQLRPGKTAPEIAGEDLDGARLKLSDYRGKVVLLVFWASWCGPCMAEVPHERELVERFKGRPFVVIGVDGDEEKAKARRAVAEKQIGWRSFWNGPAGAYGAINTAWNIRMLPTVYVIDHKGVIRDTHIEGADMDAALAKLVAEAEAAIGGER